MTMPPLPLPAPHATSFYANPLFTDDQMRAYGEACAAAERERCARVAEWARAVLKTANVRGNAHLTAAQEVEDEQE